MIAELELQDRVHLLGETKPEPLAALMAGCCFLVLPSTCEPWGLVVNEAMHAGRPVLGSQACGCAPELLQSGAAWLLRGFGAGDLAEGMERALADKPNWNTMGKHATEIAAEFKPDRHAEIVVEALQQVMALPEGRR
jgi:glycosyltransferase involved in cell wall biosynthesis